MTVIIPYDFQNSINGDGNLKS